VGLVDISEAIDDSIERSTHFHFSQGLGQTAERALANRAPSDARETNIRVTNDGTVEAILKLGDEFGADQSICAMNFASAKNPGGGFLGGSSAQEESLARSSTLYPTLMKFLEQKEIKGKEATYYHINRRIENRGIYTSCAIYSPDVQVIRSEDGQLRTPMRCSFVTIPAPNKRVKNCPGMASATEAIVDRIDRTLAIALLNNHLHLVLGAFGCGVFGNDPGVVASIFKQLLCEKYRACFETVVFAIKTPRPETDENFKAFLSAFGT
jgi:uncharacterized protein (TIGR02452 family)